MKPSIPSRRWRNIGTPLLLLYIATVALAGWPPEARPALLEAAHQRAFSTLRLLGVSAGQPLFHTDEGPWKQRGFCLLIRARPEPEDGNLLFPPGGVCEFDGFHPRLPPVNRATHRMLSAAWRSASASRNRTEQSDRYTAAVARHFCTRGDRRPERIEAVWTWYFLHYESGDVRRQNGLMFAYDCSDEILDALFWLPPDDSVVAFWGGGAVGVTPARILARVQGWLFDPQPIFALVAGRIVFGSILLICYLVRLPDAWSLYGADGFGGREFLQRLDPSDTVFQAVYDGLGLSLAAPGPVALTVLYGILLLSAASFAVGFRTRTSGWILWLLHLYLYKLRLHYAYWGWPALLQGFMLYVLLSRAGDFYSVDAWLARRRDGQPAPAFSAWVASAWPLRLLQCHLCAMYATVGWSRIESSGWLAGHTVFEAVTTSLHSRLVIDWEPFKEVLQAATWGVFALEPSAVVLLWLPWIGPVIAYALLAMHAGLELLTNVGWWSFTVVPGLLAFLPRSHLEALFRRLPGIRAG